MSPLDAADVERALQDIPIGRDDGVVICDGCGATHDIPEHGSRLYTLFILSAGHMQKLHVQGVYCEHCDVRVIDRPSPGYAEFLVACSIDGDPPRAKSPRVIDTTHEAVRDAQDSAQDSGPGAGAG